MKQAAGSRQHICSSWPMSDCKVPHRLQAEQCLVDIEKHRLGP